MNSTVSPNSQLLSLCEYINIRQFEVGFLMLGFVIAMLMSYLVAYLSYGRRLQRTYKFQNLKLLYECLFGIDWRLTARNKLFSIEDQKTVRSMTKIFILFLIIFVAIFMLALAAFSLGTCK